MKFPIFALGMLFFALQFSTAVVPAAAEGLFLSPEALAALRSSKVADRDRALDELAAASAPEALDMLRALAAGSLHMDRESGELFVLDDKTGTARGVLDGEVRPADGGGLRRVGTNTAQRDRILSILGARLLSHPDPVRRRAAAAALTDGPMTVDRTQLEALRDRETDEETRESLDMALALMTAQDAAAAPQSLLKSVELLRASGSPRAKTVLESLAANPDRAVAVAAAEALEHKRIVSDWAAMLETMFFGLSLGSVLILTSIGLAITFGVMGVINMAHGELVMLGAYTVWGLQQLLPSQPGTALLLSVPAAFLVSGGVGVVLERGVIRHLYGRPLETLLATFGISLILQQAVRTLISPQNRAVGIPDFMSGLWRISGELSLTCNRIYILCFCLAVFALIYAIMHKTRLGLEVRAVTQNRAIAKALGVNASRVDALTFALGSGVAGMAGVALSQLTNVGPNLGQSYIVDSFMVVVFGGVGNLWGTLSGGLILGLVNKILEPASGAMLAKIIILAGLILFMQARPRGLFPQRGRAAED
ncbi:MAG: urea ABC transporter permease subunit UrtB [Desulfovibrio sp.]|jgi:urea transport system permease protein|nr:urea ABC transporter permease subunit UrtB [Desulfovibrio sp.]